MIENTQYKAEAELANGSFDDLMAKLYVLVTHHSLTQCNESLPRIVRLLRTLFDHPEIELFPSQRKVLIKMHHLWQTKLFQNQQSPYRH